MMESVENMRNNRRIYAYKWKIVSCAVLCSMLLGACGQYAEKQQDKAEAQPEPVEHPAENAGETAEEEKTGKENNCCVGASGGAA